jgi:hypothetical protein
MKKLAAFFIVASFCISFAAPVCARADNTAKSQARASQKAARKQQKALKKYTKAQQKAQRKMAKRDRKNTHYPKRSF